MTKTRVRLTICAGVIGAFTLVPAGAAFAAANPSGTGQPSQECGEGDALANPPGFDSAGFAHAETVYAGAQDQNSKNSRSVAQYDVACFQVSQH